MDDGAPPPDVTEEPYHCAGRCGAVIGMLVRVGGRPVGLHVQTVTGGWMLVRSLSGVCDACGGRVRFSLADDALERVGGLLAEMKAAGLW